VSPDVARLAAGAATALVVIDVVLVARGVIGPVCLADAAAEVALVAWWAAAGVRKPAPAQSPRHFTSSP
jgi:hypothetical protein